MKLKNIIGYKIIIPNNRKKMFKNEKEIFGFFINHYYSIPYQTTKDLDLVEQIIEKELNLLNDFGMVIFYKKPKIGDRCYFWNGMDNKMKATKKGKPFISTLESVDNNGRFSATDEEIMNFKYCEKI